MFPDLKIASKCQQIGRKVLELEIASYLKTQLLNDFRGSPFCFKFIETTAVKIKNNMMAFFSIDWLNGLMLLVPIRNLFFLAITTLIGL